VKEFTTLKGVAGYKINIFSFPPPPLGLGVLLPGVGGLI